MEAGGDFVSKVGHFWSRTEGAAFGIEMRFKWHTRAAGVQGLWGDASSFAVALGVQQGLSSPLLEGQGLQQREGLTQLL